MKAENKPYDLSFEDCYIDELKRDGTVILFDGNPKTHHSITGAARHFSNDDVYELFQLTETIEKGFWKKELVHRHHYVLARKNHGPWHVTFAASLYQASYLLQRFVDFMKDAYEVPMSAEIYEPLNFVGDLIMSGYVQDITIVHYHYKDEVMAAVEESMKQPAEPPLSPVVEAKRVLAEFMAEEYITRLPFEIPDNDQYLTVLESFAGYLCSKSFTDLVKECEAVLNDLPPERAEKIVIALTQVKEALASEAKPA